MPIVKFTPNLKRYFPDLQPLKSDLKSIAGLIAEANKLYPGLESYILDEQGGLRKHVQIFIGENMIHDRKGLTDPISDQDQVYIMQALSGG